MRNVDGRSLFTYTCILVAGLALLALVSPSVGNHIPLAVLSSLLSIIPLIAVGTLLYYQLGTSKQTTKMPSHRSSVLLADIAAASMVLSVTTTVISTYQPAFAAGTLRYVFENIGVGLLFLAFVCTLLLINRQKFVYWPFWNTKDRKSADERQRTVRNRVYEKSYRATIVLLIIVAWLNGHHSQRLHDELLQATALCLFGIPAIIGAWQKDG